MNGGRCGNWPAWSAWPRAQLSSLLVATRFHQYGVAVSPDYADQPRCVMKGIQTANPTPARHWDISAPARQATRPRQIRRPNLAHVAPSLSEDAVATAPPG